MCNVWLYSSENLFTGSLNDVVIVICSALKAKIMWCVLVTLFISCFLCSPGRYSCWGRRFPPRLRLLPCRWDDIRFPCEPNVHFHSCSSFSALTRTHWPEGCHWRWGWGLNSVHWSSVCNTHAYCRVGLPHAVAACCSQNDVTVCEKWSDRLRPPSPDEQW